MRPVEGARQSIIHPETAHSECGAHAHVGPICAGAQDEHTSCSQRSAIWDYAHGLSTMAMRMPPLSAHTGNVRVQRHARPVQAEPPSSLGQKHGYLFLMLIHTHVKYVRMSKCMLMSSTIRVMLVQAGNKGLGPS